MPLFAACLRWKDVRVRLVEALSAPLYACEELAPFWALLDGGQDASCGIAQSARPFMVAARFARMPQPTLVVVAGEDAADACARSCAAFLGQEAVLRFPLRPDTPWAGTEPDPCLISRRMEAAHALASSRDCVVVASARALLRKLPPASAQVARPLVVQREGAALSGGEPVGYDQVAAALVALGYENTVELEGPGTFAARGGTVDVHPGNLAYPVRIDFFGDEIEDIRRIVPATGQSIQPLACAEVYPVRELAPSRRAVARAREALHNPAKTNPVLRELLEKLEGGVRGERYDALLPYLYGEASTLGEWLPSDALTVLV